MKNLYIFSACVLAAVALGLGVLHVRYRPPANQLPPLPQPEAAKPGAHSPAKPKPDPEVVWKNNLFDPNRGKVEKPDAKAELQSALPRNFKIEQLELQGIFKFGDKAKAIIDDKNPQQRPPPATVAAMQGPRPGPGQPPLGPGARQKPSEPPKPKKIFSVGEVMPNGLTVKAITEKSVILTYQTEEYTLKLQHGDRDSLKRGGETAFRSPATIIGEGGAAISEAQPASQPAAVQPTPDLSNSNVGGRPPLPPLPFSRGGPGRVGAPGASGTPPPAFTPGTPGAGQAGIRNRGRFSMQPTGE